jgi:uncharacterized protein (TIGR02466 family)
MYQLFVTEVYHSSIQFDLKSLRQDMLKIAQADRAGQKWSEKNYPNGYTSYGSWDQLHRMSSTFAVLQKKIDRHVTQFAKKLEFDLSERKLRMDSLWINIMPPGASHSSHLHPHSVVSGTYYVDIPPKASALKFEDPRMAFFMNSPITKTDASRPHRRFFSLQPSAGDIVLFESWLRHEVPLNRSRRPRMSISFNYS